MNHISTLPGQVVDGGPGGQDRAVAVGAHHTDHQGIEDDHPHIM